MAFGKTLTTYPCGAQEAPLEVTPTLTLVGPVGDLEVTCHEGSGCCIMTVTAVSHGDVTVMSPVPLAPQHGGHHILVIAVATSLVAAS